MRAETIWREGNRFGARELVLVGRLARRMWVEQEIERRNESPAESPMTGWEQAIPSRVCRFERAKSRAALPTFLAPPTRIELTWWVVFAG
jgi:hypothetical protein